MIKEVDADGKTLKEFGNNFSVRQIKAFDAKNPVDPLAEKHINIDGSEAVIKTAIIIDIPSAQVV